MQPAQFRKKLQLSQAKNTLTGQLSCSCYLYLLFVFQSHDNSEMNRKTVWNQPMNYKNMNFMTHHHHLHAAVGNVCPKMQRYNFTGGMNQYYFEIAHNTVLIDIVFTDCVIEHESVDSYTMCQCLHCSHGLIEKIIPGRHRQFYANNLALQHLSLWIGNFRFNTSIYLKHIY